ncbi:hypothetical protein ACH5RR_003165 [Cinchona calisaya]|uniref:Uncharacterized protein n=1 Tax=Cinchona calisaya TaxID=153742 RepID=A0ABD3AU09_9GENT
MASNGMNSKLVAEPNQMAKTENGKKDDLQGTMMQPIFCLLPIPSIVLIVFGNSTDGDKCSRKMSTHLQAIGYEEPLPKIDQNRGKHGSARVKDKENEGLLLIDGKIATRRGVPPKTEQNSSKGTHRKAKLMPAIRSPCFELSNLCRWTLWLERGISVRGMKTRKWIWELMIY